jgi:D-glycero-alpha-D-manno-heptose-7-phosphate kinase
MIVSRTPFRVTLGGGGTDLPSFYEEYGGYVLALGIDKYMYVALNVPFADRKVRLHYTQSEVVDRVDELRHELAREALLLHGVRDAVEVASLADLPAGTGLGSSSCYLVGLLTAIRSYLNRPSTPSEIAGEACGIELDILKKPIGKQDQYMAAAGGLTELHIDMSGNVRVERVPLAGYAVAELIANTHLYYTNVQRTTTDILSKQSGDLRERKRATTASMRRILDLGREIGEAIRAQDFDAFGRLMHEHWVAKKQLSGSITLPAVEELYDYTRDEFGVLGGKVVGAGGGGFLMLYCPREGSRLTEFMERNGMPRLEYSAAFEGSRIITNVLNARPINIHVDAPASWSSRTDVTYA